MKNRTILAGAIAATLGAGGGADAALVNVALQSVVSHSSSGTSAANIGSSTATWTYNSVNGLLTQQGGLFNARYTISPTTTLFRHSTTGMVLGGGGAASATSFTCTEGNFGGNVGASLCGNYNFGANFVNESALSYGPGTAIDRTIGGDDVTLGSPQGVGAYNGMTQISWVGTTLKLSNATPTSGYTWTLATLGPAAPPPGFTVIMGPSGVASGIDNLEIMGTRYDVRFACYPYTEPQCALGPGTDLFLGNRDGALEAAYAISGALEAAGAVDVSNFSYEISGEWSHFIVPYSSTEAIRGCRQNWSCIPASGGVASYWDAQETAYTSPPPGGGHWSGYPNAYDSFSLVTFTPSAVVPLPAAAWLFGGALMGLGWLKRRAAA